MIDPINFTNYFRSDIELEECAIFSILVAGKNALTTAKCTDNFLKAAHQKANQKEFKPFFCLKGFKQPDIRDMLYHNGIGCQNAKGRSVYELVNSGLDLRKCSVEDLEKIYGIGPKTARMFVLHNRKDVDLAVLDVHILRYLNDVGYEVPTTTPTKNKYKVIEKIFLDLASKAGKSAADFDLELWRLYREKRKAS
jgi:thermostable 8-oxoguanine DNA glycosylase